MQWQEIKNKNHLARHELPQDRPFFAIWKGAYCIAEYNDEWDLFSICYLPAQMAGIMTVSRDREGKFTHWCEIKNPEEELTHKSVCF